MVSSILGVFLLTVMATPSAGAQQAAPCQFILGFQALHDLAPADVGDCTDNQAFAPNGDAQQHTTRGLMAWRKLDNWTAFTNGYKTWINGPNGLVSRLNSDRFPWEGPDQPAVAAPAPQPTPTPKVKYAWNSKRVADPPNMYCGSGQAYPCLDSAPNAGTQYVSGRVIRKDSTVGIGYTVQG